MANRERGEAGLEVNGKRYTLRPSFDAVCELEALVDKTFDDVMHDIQRGRLSGLRACVWCLLNWYHGDEIKTLRDASQWIEDAGGTDVVLAVVVEMLELNSRDEGDPARPPKARARRRTARAKPAEASIGDRSLLTPVKSA